MNSDKAKERSPKLIQNRKARFDYEIIDSYEAGIVLAGPEVKSLFLGRANLTDAYCDISSGEAWLHNCDIEPYAFSTHYQPERRRTRKLLMHRKEISIIERKAQEKGFTIIPLKIYFKNGYAKIEIALAKGKRSYDKRDQIAHTEARKEAARAKIGREF